MWRFLVAAAILLSGCASEAPPTSTPAEAQPEPLQLAYQGLCDAGDVAESGDMWGAANVFNIESHAYLHELAAEAQAEDPSVAATLLEAKQAVEVQLQSPDSADPQTVVSSLSALEVAMGDAAESLGYERPGCG